MTTTTSTHVANPLKQLTQLGQSIWLDYIRRSLITSGELKHLIEDDGLAGMTSNPAIFEKAITGSTDYADVLSRAAGSQGPGRQKQSTSCSAIRDIQDAADETSCALARIRPHRSAATATSALEVSPFLANETQATIEEALQALAAP